MRRALAFVFLYLLVGCGPIGSSPLGVLAPPAPRAPLEPPTFHGASRPIVGADQARMSHSWRPGCPVAIEDLRLLTLDHWGYDGRVHEGELVIHRRHARAVLGVFEELFEARFPIRRMRLVDEYGADDDRSMAANNTSAFNCRPVTGGTGWSQHSYGWAIDINPVQNPYVTSGGTVLPPEGVHYLDRSRKDKGMIRAGGVVVKAFAAIGWEWGGTWTSTKDYQHFSATGR